METIDIVNKLFKFKITEHSTIKDKTLKSIDDMGKYSYIDSDQHITNTDWHLSKDFKRPYIDVVVPVLQKYYSQIGLEPYTIWFQQYYPNDYHGWHGHGVSYSSVYFLELPDSSIKTQFENLEIEVEEGDFIIFPGISLHRSPPNTTTSRKTSIVVNLHDSK